VLHFDPRHRFNNNGKGWKTLAHRH